MSTSFSLSWERRSHGLLRCELGEGLGDGQRREGKRVHLQSSPPMASGRLICIGADELKD